MEEPTRLNLGYLTWVRELEALADLRQVDMPLSWQFIARQYRDGASAREALDRHLARPRK